MAERSPKMFRSPLLRARVNLYAVLAFATGLGACWISSGIAGLINDAPPSTASV